VRRLRDFASIAAFFSEREIEELQAAIDARREARMGRQGGPAKPAAPGEAKDRPVAPLPGGPPHQAPDR
jgi:hypothetical protein